MKNVQLLLDLQNVDRQLFALERAKGDLPRSLEEMKDRLAELAVAHAQKSASAAAVLQARHVLENALSLARERKKKYESQLYAVKTNKEYDAITLEIENTEKEIDQNETKIIEALDQEERLKQELAQDDAQIKALALEKQQQEETLNRLLEQNKSQVERLLNERQQLAAGLELVLLRSYDRIRRGKEGGEAVTVIHRGSCGGCRTRIPSQRLMELRDMNQIYYCENCGRILIWQEEEAVAV
ncbi:MAG: zinc ribbon domain-containing protein [bacterium]